MPALKLINHYKVFVLTRQGDQLEGFSHSTDFDQCAPFFSFWISMDDPSVTCVSMDDIARIIFHAVYEEE